MVDEEKRLDEVEGKLHVIREILAVTTIIAFVAFLAVPIVGSVIGAGTYSTFFGAAWNTTLLYALLIANAIGYLWSDA
ncbi:MAG: hypothetical protein QW505_01945 [Thermoplasmata archaeon]